MASVYAPNVAQFNLNFTYQSEPAQNTLYMLFETEPDSSDLDSISLQLYDNWATSAASFCPTTVRLNNVQGISLDQAGAPVGGYTPSVAITGEDLGASAPNNVTISVSFKTGFSGKSRRGRNYWIGLLDANVTDNRLDGLVMTAIQNYYNNLLPGGGGLSGCIWGVYSRFENNAPRTVGLFTPVTQVTFANNVVDSQRGRLP